MGVDCVLEILDWEKPTGMLALIQLKSTEKEIKELSKTKGLISCPNVSKSNLHYCQQNRIPMILVYAHVDVETNRCDRFYFTDIREEGLRLLGTKEQDSYTLHIPINNCNLTRMRFLFELIEQNYR